jgi:putative ATP-binding cassette transporter
MQLLSIILAAFSALSFSVYYARGELLVLLLAFSSAGLAVTTFLSPRISTYLRIFSTTFAVETVAFGLCAFAAKWGWWPEFLASARIPDTLTLTVSVFGLMVFGLSYVPVVQTVMRKADPYFEAAEPSDYRIPGLPNVAIDERWLAIGLVVFLVVLNQFQVYINLVLTFFNRDWFNAIEQKNGPEFWRLLWQVFLVWASVSIVTSIIEVAAQGFLVLRWRQWLTHHMIGDWLGRNVHYQMTLAGEVADNPDQRIAEDVRSFVGGTSLSGAGTYDFSISLMSQLSNLVTFSILLWTLSANFTVPGTELKVPGLLFWVALVYAVVGTVATHVVGRPLIGLSFDQQKYEANFRFAMARIREYSEQISLLGGERAERSALVRRFRDIYANFVALIKRIMKLNIVVSAYGQINVLVPYIFAAPFYFAGQITLGVMTQTAQAFGRVDAAFSFFIDRYRSLATYKSMLDRLTTFDAAAARVRAAAARDKAVRVRQGAADELRIDKLALALPDGRTIVRVEDLTLKPHESALVTGPSGSGKSTLFRAIAGIWPLGDGEVLAPTGKTMLLLPQRPYIPQGTLRSAIAYPAGEDAYGDDAIREALARVKLSHLQGELDREDQWQQRLSGGEQQRLAFARALLSKPDWLFLDEATASLDEPLEADIYAALRKALPKTTIVSIGHRSTLTEMHDRQIVMTPDPDGVFTPRAREKVGA